jgi:uncharacterized NAD(P)/FAD-binding protein YdhS
MTEPTLDAAIIGAGASGVLAALQIRRASPGSGIALVEAGARAARGLAYGTPYGAHLLNVRAGNMSAFPDDPDHFVRWLAARVPGTGAETYAPRPLYGEYLASVLEGVRPTRVQGTAVGLTRQERAWMVHLHDGRTVRGAVVVLALGNLAPDDPPELSRLNDDRYVRDPWGPGVASGLDRDAPIMMVGSGLTMIDLVLALRAEGHRGRIHALSRHGLLPREHAEYLPRPLPGPLALATPAAAARWVRCEIEPRPSTESPHDPCHHQRHDWRAVVDGLRPHTATIWKGWTVRQRASFLRHARYLWDVHRHRVAPEVAERIRALLDSDELKVHRGRIVAVDAVPGGLIVRWRRRGEAAEESLAVARLVNCTGPNSNYGTIDLPLVVQLRRAGYLVPDALGLGVETGDHGALLGRDGNPVPGLFTLGPLRRPGLWETTAIPEIRAQAAALASLLGARGSG